MKVPHNLHADETAMVGKIVVIWLLMVALLAVVALDTVSVIMATFRASDVAATAATAAATEFRNGRDVSDACDAARASIEESSSSMQAPKSFCKVDTKTGRVTIVVKTRPSTIIAGRLSFTEDLTRVTGRETAGPTAL